MIRIAPVGIILTCIACVLASSTPSKYFEAESHGDPSVPMKSNMIEELSHLHIEEPAYSTQDDISAPNWSGEAQPGITLDYEPQEDLTGRDLINIHWLREIPPHLYGRDLIKYYKDFSQAIKPFLSNVMQLRSHVLDEAEHVAPLFRDYAVTVGVLEATSLANKHSPFAGYESALQYLAKWDEIMTLISKRASALTLKFVSGMHRVGQWEYQDVEPLKQEAIQFGRDVKSMTYWTKLNALDRIDEVIRMNREKEPKAIIAQTRVREAKLAQRLGL